MYAFCFLQDYATISRCNCAIPTAAAGIDIVKLGKCMPTDESKITKCSTAVNDTAVSSN